MGCFLQSCSLVWWLRCVFTLYSTAQHISACRTVSFAFHLEFQCIFSTFWLFCTLIFFGEDKQNIQCNICFYFYSMNLQQAQCCIIDINKVSWSVRFSGLQRALHNLCSQRGPVLNALLLSISLSKTLQDLLKSPWCHNYGPAMRALVGEDRGEENAGNVSLKCYPFSEKNLREIMELCRSFPDQKKKKDNKWQSQTHAGGLKA